MVTIRQLAENSNISYEAARQQVTRYKEELGEHLVYKGKTRFLDEEAVSILQKIKETNPVSMMNAEKDNKIKQLESDKEKLLARVAELEDQVKKLQQANAVLSGEVRGHRNKKRRIF